MSTNTTSPGRSRTCSRWSPATCRQPNSALQRGWPERRRAEITRPTPIRVHRLSSPLGDWELALGEPSPPLRPLVRGQYTGSVERCAGLVRRLEIPHPGIVCIFNFGDGYHVTDPRRGADSGWLGSFVAGLYDSWVLVDAEGISQCVQCNLTPLGALRLLGLPMRELTNRSVPMDELLGPSAQLLAERLHAAATWEARFAVLEAALLERLERAPAVPPLVTHAWHLLSADGGACDVSALAKQLRCSRRHLSAQLQEHAGLPPKLLARIIRFDRAVERLASGGGRRLAGMAHDCGYYDHAHLDRDFREFSGLSPSAYLALRHPTFGALVVHD